MISTTDSCDSQPSLDNTLADIKLSNVRKTGKTKGEKHKYDSPRNEKYRYAYEVNFGKHTIRLQTIEPLHNSQPKQPLSESDRERIIGIARKYYAAVWRYDISESAHAEVRALAEHKHGVTSGTEVRANMDFWMKFAE